MRLKSPMLWGFLIDKPVIRQMGQQLFSIAFGQQASIKNGNPPLISFLAQQPTTSLNQFDADRRQGQSRKGLSSSTEDPFLLGLFNRSGKDRERKFSDNHMGTQITRQIDPFGKTIHT